MTEENWKPVVGYEGSYEVSDLGRVRSLDRMRSDGLIAIKGRVLKLGRDAKGYLQAGLCRVRPITHRVHILVLKAFVGPCPEGMEGCHNDGDSSNNRRNNLRWDTRKNNNADKVSHQTSSSGERNYFSKFNSTDVERIFDLRRNGCTQQQIADWLGCSLSNVSLILLGKTWAHLRSQSLPRS